MRHDERGQTSLEWLGIAAVVAGLLVAVATADLATSVRTAFTDLLCRVTASCEGSGGGTAGGDAFGATAVSRSPVGPSSGDPSVGGPSSGDPSSGDDVLTDDELAAIRVVIAGGDDGAIHEALDALSPDEVAQLVDTAAGEVALVDGVPQDIRVAANAQLIADHIAAMEAEVARLQPDGLIDRIRDDLHDIGDAVNDLFSPGEHLADTPDEAIFGTPEAHTDTERISLLTERIERYEDWIEEGRQIIRFEPPDDIVNGDAIVVEVFGDLDTAANVGIVVPGVWNDDDNYDEALRADALDLVGMVGEDTAVVAHLGYDTPESLVSVEAATAGRAQAGADSLASFIDSLDADGTDRLVTLVGHSYGTRAAVEATRLGTDVDQLVILGSPGVGVDTAGQTGVPAGDVYIATNDDDPISSVPNVDVLGLGHGRDPAAEDFGGQLLPGDGVAHPGYFEPGTGVGDSVSALVDGRPGDVIVIDDRGEGR